MTRQIAIIGAGIAGLAAARQLHAAGLACTLFDKGRGVGGRMATRRVDGFHFDHGAQFFTAKGASFGALVAEWRDAGQAAEWFDGAFVGTPGMSTPTNALAADGLGFGPYEAVILAMPAPQIVPLLAMAGLSFHELAAVRYAPCWALMLGFRAPVAMPWDRLRPDDEAVAWIACGAGKPGREGQAETVVAHATPAWSRNRLEDDAATITRDLLARVQALTGIEAAPDFAASHRWRHALVEQPAGIACLWDAEARIGACGDWALGPRIEAAFDSGEALAAAVIGALESDNAD